MKIEDIQTLVAELNAAAAKPTKKTPVKAAPKEAAAPAVKTNGHSHLTPEESLAIAAKRIALAFNMAAKGITPESLIARVKFFEAKGQGVVQ